MLQKVPKAVKAASLKARQKRCRLRQRAGVMVVPVEIDGQVLDLLIKMGWVTEADAGSREKVGQAIGQRLARSAIL